MSSCYLMENLKLHHISQVFIIAWFSLWFRNESVWWYGGKYWFPSISKYWLKSSYILGRILPIKRNDPSLYTISHFISLSKQTGTAQNGHPFTYNSLPIKYNTQSLVPLSFSLRLPDSYFTYFSFLNSFMFDQPRQLSPYSHCPAYYK